ncbi:MAG: hypothetical protein FJW95_03150 [Actinobacteria bacterium]|nr:hypothetical protein [Actinomycetota bacterium]
MSRPVRLHAIYVALDDAALFRASIASIYGEVDGITVVTTHDRDWRGSARDPSAITAMVLSRDVDPDRKVDLIITSETSEARSRGRAMDFAAPRRRTLDVDPEHRSDAPHRSPDYFLIVDADEIYEAGAITRLKEHVARGRHRYYRVPCVRYFKRWNYRIDGHEWALSVVRADRRVPYLRRRRTVSVVRRGLARVPGLPSGAVARLLGYWDVPPEVACFHHGSYVGPRERIAAKLASFGHADEVPDAWMTQVYDRWTTDAVDFNPAYPTAFPSAREVPVDELPPEIRGFAWPDGYLLEDDTTSSGRAGAASEIGGSGKASPAIPGHGR